MSRVSRTVIGIYVGIGLAKIARLPGTLVTMAMAADDNDAIKRYDDGDDYYYYYYYFLTSASP